jgi:hypothetical protein
MVDVAGCQNDRVQSAVYAPNALLTMPRTAVLTSPASSCFAGMSQLFPIGRVAMAFKYTHAVLFPSCASQFALKV